MNILVTGASGFIGSHLIKLLSKRNNVKCLSRKKIVQNKNIQVIHGNILSGKTLKEASSDVSVIIHLAAIKYNSRNPLHIKRVNLDGTRKLLEFSGSSHFIYASTWLAAYPKLTGHYGKTKNKAEKLVKKTKKFTILRFPHIYSNSLSMIFTKYLLNIYLRLRYRVKPIYEPISVEELCLAIEKVINNKKFFQGSYYVKDRNTFIPF